MRNLSASFVRLVPVVLAAWALTVGLIAVARANDALVPAELLNNDGDRVNFHRLHPPVGSTVRYTTTMSVDGEMTMTFGQMNFKGEMSTTEVSESEATLDELEAGLPVAWREKILVDRSDTSLTMMGEVEEEEERGVLVGETVRVRVVDGVQRAELVGGKATQEQREALDEEYAGPPDYVMYPDNPIAPGDAWDMEPEMIAAFAAGGAMDIEHAEGTVRYVRNDEVRGRPAAVFAYEITLVGMVDEDEEPARVEMEFTATERRCLTHGITLAFEATGPMTVTGELEEQGETLKMRVTGDAVMSVVGEMQD